MNWTDVKATATHRQLRQFSGGLVVLAAGWLTWRAVEGRAGAAVWLVAAAGFAIGTAGLVFPRLIRPLYRAAMLAAFPIGWITSRVALAIVFYVVLTPLALLFRATGRDTLRLRKTKPGSYWTARPAAGDDRRYLRQY